MLCADEMGLGKTLQVLQSFLYPESSTHCSCQAAWDHVPRVCMPRACAKRLCAYVAGLFSFDCIQFQSCSFLQAIGLAACYKEDWPVLVLVPSALRLHWAIVSGKSLPKISWHHLTPICLHDLLVDCIAIAMCEGCFLQLKM